MSDSTQSLPCEDLTAKYTKMKQVLSDNEGKLRAIIFSDGSKVEILEKAHLEEDATGFCIFCFTADSTDPKGFIDSPLVDYELLLKCKEAYFKLAKGQEVFVNDQTTPNMIQLYTQLCNILGQTPDRHFELKELIKVCNEADVEADSLTNHDSNALNCDDLRTNISQVKTFFLTIQAALNN